MDTGKHTTNLVRPQAKPLVIIRGGAIKMVSPHVFHRQKCYLNQVESRVFYLGTGSKQC